MMIQGLLTNLIFGCTESDRFQRGRSHCCRDLAAPTLDWWRFGGHA